jgi:hypothetical protein
MEHTLNGSTQAVMMNKLKRIGVILKNLWELIFKSDAHY